MSCESDIKYAILDLVILFSIGKGTRRRQRKKEYYL